MNPLKPCAMEISEVAWRLSNKYRWSAEIPVSIASHSLAVEADLCLCGASVPVRLQGLLHDAPEAPLCDMPTPLKPVTTVEYEGRKISWRALEDIWAEIMLPALGAEWPLNPAVKDSDLRAMFFEVEAWGLISTTPQGEVAVGRSQTELVAPQPLVMMDFLEKYRELTDGT